ncbi:MAG: hypothetical protein CL840_21530 [Crocinitomicaceae bacterium]|nr:hypothetical protein [Crocinitomicaceae bacterium]|tara:strand:+ start:2916 stop:3500 length:585 start_codon:yes stop_codon:yes gene_type:complete
MNYLLLLSSLLFSLVFSEPKSDALTPNKRYVKWVYKDYQNVGFLIRKVEAYNDTCFNKEGKMVICGAEEKLWDLSIEHNKKLVDDYLRYFKLKYKMISKTEYEEEEYSVEEYPFYIDYEVGWVYDSRVSFTVGGSFMVNPNPERRVRAFYFLVDRKTGQKQRFSLNPGAEMVEAFLVFIKTTRKRRPLRLIPYA